MTCKCKECKCGKKTGLEELESMFVVIKDPVFEEPEVEQTYLCTRCYGIKVDDEMTIIHHRFVNDEVVSDSGICNTCFDKELEDC